MPLLAEEVVQEWLNRQGFFTIRGIKAGNSEIDLLAVRLTQQNGTTTVDCRHVEVQVSHNPIKYITAKSARRLTHSELKASVEVWLSKKYAGSGRTRYERLSRLGIGRGSSWFIRSSTRRKLIGCVNAA